MKKFRNKFISELIYAIARTHDRALFYAIFKFGISVDEVFVFLKYVATLWIMTVSGSLSKRKDETGMISPNVGQKHRRIATPYPRGMMALFYYLFPGVRSLV
jgi:hypothetical protein